MSAESIRAVARGLPRPALAVKRWTALIAVLGSEPQPPAIIARRAGMRANVGRLWLARAAAAGLVHAHRVAAPDGSPEPIATWYSRAGA